MSQLVIKPRIWAPTGTGARREVFGATPWRVPDRIHELVATAIAVIDRTRSRLLEPGEQVAQMESSYFQSARMAREMYRL